MSQELSDFEKSAFARAGGAAYKQSGGAMAWALGMASSVRVDRMSAQIHGITEDGFATLDLLLPPA